MVNEWMNQLWNNWRLGKPAAAQSIPFFLSISALWEWAEWRKKENWRAWRPTTAQPFHSTSIQKKLLIWLVELELIDGWMGLLFLNLGGLWALQRQWLRPKKKTNKQTHFIQINQLRRKRKGMEWAQQQQAKFNSLLFFSEEKSDWIGVACCCGENEMEGRGALAGRQRPPFSNSKKLK